MAENLQEQSGLPNLLVPYTEFEAEDLAKQLQTLVMANGSALAMRGLRGVVARYSDAETAVQKVRKGQSEHPELGHYAIVSDSGNVVGGASIMPMIELKKQALPLPPVLARGRLATALPKATPNIHAWTDKYFAEHLAPAYAELVFRSSALWKRADNPKPWTIEPVRSPKLVHEAIALSGLEKVAVGRFDDAESKRHIPPRSVLYARLYSDWSTSRGKLKELRTGQKSFWTHMDEANNEIMSRNPRGA